MNILYKQNCIARIRVLVDRYFHRAGYNSIDIFQYFFYLKKAWYFHELELVAQLERVEWDLCSKVGGISGFVDQ